MAAIVASGESVSRRKSDPTPEHPADFFAWYVGNPDRTLAFLGSRDPDSLTWTLVETNGQGNSSPTWPQKMWISSRDLSVLRPEDFLPPSYASHYVLLPDQLVHWSDVNPHAQ
jgi:hypothetical protein